MGLVVFVMAFLVEDPFYDDFMKSIYGTVQ